MIGKIDKKRPQMNYLNFKIHKPKCEHCGNEMEVLTSPDEYVKTGMFRLCCETCNKIFNYKIDKKDD